MEIEEKYKKACSLLRDVWLNIDWDKYGGSRMTIWSVFEGQVRALSRCYSRLEPFVDKLARRFHSFVDRKETIEIISENNDFVYLDIFRNETQIPMMLLRIERDEAKQAFKEKKEAKAKNEGTQKKEEELIEELF
jgi:hypothetical protein